MPMPMVNSWSVRYAETLSDLRLQPNASGYLDHAAARHGPLAMASGKSEEDVE